MYLPVDKLNEPDADAMKSGLERFAIFCMFQMITGIFRPVWKFVAAATHLKRSIPGYVGTCNYELYKNMLIIPNVYNPFLQFENA